jgi:cyanate permease
MLVSIAGSALGPMPMGIARDWMGSYLPALTVSAVLPLALAVVALFARRPERKEASIRIGRGEHGVD